MRRWFAAALVLFTASSAWAESEEEEAAPLSAAPIEAKGATKLKDPEDTGFYIGAASGIALTISPGGNTYTPDPTTGQLVSGSAGLAMGQSGGIELGYQPMPLLAIGVLAWGSAANTPSTYLGTCDPVASAAAGNSCPHGNSTKLLLGANARLNLSLGADSNDARRAYFFVRAGAGFAILAPKGLLGNELVVFGGPGIEYYTRLRHFSVGIEADASYGLTNKTLGVQIQPLVRYMF